ncbi:hypothetical protein T492DRAFT_862016 [Pavlovales sp. CCMP2436]|nr:hypothetical protein T492DRAFT_862016 [Pavlovales sp. CCMP2436]
MWCASALASLLLLFGSMLDGSRTEGAAPTAHGGDQRRCAREPGSSTFTLSDIEVLVAARRVRVPDVELVEARQGSRRAEHSTRRFVISPDSLQQIRSEMPTSDDEWEVEKVDAQRVKELCIERQLA